MNKAKSTGIDGTMLLQMVFIYLKLVEKVNWTWKQVFIPTWISIGLFAVYIVLTIVLGVVNIRNKR